MFSTHNPGVKGKPEREERVLIKSMNKHKDGHFLQVDEPADAPAWSLPHVMTYVVPVPTC